MNERIVVLSDLHLGRPRGGARSVQALRPLWQGADHLVVNGDLAEIHHPRHWATAARETMHLFDLCERDGVELTLLSGNHDPYLSDIRHLHLAEGRVLVTHGDALHPAIAPWSPASARLRDANEQALAALPLPDRDQLESRLAASQHASYAEWQHIEALEREAKHSTFRGMFGRPWVLVKVLLYWRKFPALAAGFLEAHAPGARFGILGHTHHAGVWEIGGRVIINTGSFGFPGKPHAVVLAGGILEVRRVRRGRSAYVLDDREIARFDLETSPPGSSGCRGLAARGEAAPTGRS